MASPLPSRRRQNPHTSSAAPLKKSMPSKNDCREDRDGTVENG